MNRSVLSIILTLLLATITAGSSAKVLIADSQLQEVVVLGGKQKAKHLSNRGMRIAGAVSTFTPDKLGYEVGSELSVKHPFEVESIDFDIVSSGIAGAVLSIQIYNESTFAPLLSHPMRATLQLGGKQTIAVSPTERTLLPRGKYIIAITFADCDEEIKQQWAEIHQWDSATRYRMQSQSIQFPLYLKDGCIRSRANDSFESLQVNIGIKVVGKEYRS